MGGNRHYDGPPVAIVGNGPVGQTTALLLAKWGIPSMLLDGRSERDEVGSKAICQQRDVLDIWSSVGAGQIAQDGLTWTKARTFYKDSELFSWSFVDRGRSPLPAFVNISQTRSEQVLDQQIAKSPLITTLWDHEVTGIEQDASGVTLTCNTGQGSTTITGSYAVVAAGARNDLRKALGVSFDGHSFDDRFLICDIRADLPGWENERRFYFDPEWNPGRQILIHPCPGSTFRIDWQVPADFDIVAERAEGRLDQRIRAIIGDRPYEVVWESVYRFHSRLVDRMRVGKVLLAGDAAHLVAPFGARGLNSGVADAENAAWKLAYVLHDWAPEALLESYHQERHCAAQENLEITSATMKFLVPQNDHEWSQRLGLLEESVTSTEAQGRVDSGRFAEPFWYIDSPLTTPAEGRTFGGRPPRGETPTVVPGVLMPDMPTNVAHRPEVVRLRQLVRDGVLVLTSDNVDAAEIGVLMKETLESPFDVLRFSDVDPDGALQETLAVRDGEAWVIRPDGHVAAAVEATPDALTNAVHRVTHGAR